jgi:hypothetical protein
MKKFYWLILIAFLQCFFVNNGFSFYNKFVGLAYTDSEMINNNSKYDVSNLNALQINYGLNINNTFRIGVMFESDFKNSLNYDNSGNLEETIGVDKVYGLNKKGLFLDLEYDLLQFVVGNNSSVSWFINGDVGGDLIIAKTIVNSNTNIMEQLYKVAFTYKIGSGLMYKMNNNAIFFKYNFVSITNPISYKTFQVETIYENFGAVKKNSYYNEYIFGVKQFFGGSNRIKIEDMGDIKVDSSYFVGFNLGFSFGNNDMYYDFADNKYQFASGSIVNLNDNSFEFNFGKKLRSDFRYIVSLSYNTKFAGEDDSEYQNMIFFDGDMVDHFYREFIYAKDFRTTELMLSFEYDILKIKSSKVFLDLGFGIDWNFFTYGYEYSGLSENKSGQSMSFPYKIGIGYEYKMLKNIAINVNYNYFFTGKVKIFEPIDSLWDKTDNYYYVKNNHSTVYLGIRYFL